MKHGVVELADAGVVCKDRLRPAACVADLLARMSLGLVNAEPSASPSDPSDSPSATARCSEPSNPRSSR